MVFCNKNNIDSDGEVTCPHCRDRIGFMSTSEWGAECSTLHGTSRCPNCNTLLELIPKVVYEVDIIYDEKGDRK